ncbi:MAG: adenylate/guanylate cyclase domain-containing protein, partial [Candidatus Riflebacteria bacterium]|nr:adenylate/guanylate cyclase domain-containing protein [Candidatus Riflebacteria bacterium]
RITHSIPAKLWLTLLIVAVIPVITVFFVFSLYKSEFLSVEKSQKRDEMQRLMISFEGKKEFSYPLVWHDINRNYSSDALDSYIRILNNKSNSDDSRKKALANLRTYFKKMIDNNNKSAKVEQISKDIISCHISNVSIRGKAGWSFCSSDNEKEDSFEDKEIDFESFEKKEQENTEKKQSSLNTVSYLDDYVGGQDDTFGIMLKMVVKFLMNRQSRGNAASKSLKETATDEIAIGTSLEIVKAFFGEDTFIKISHGINIPIIFNIGFGKFGLMISSYPNFKNPEAVFVWLVIIETIDYLKDIQDKIETDIKIFINESFRYGTVAENTKDNNLRIPLGKYMSWLSSSFLPISTSIQLNDGNYLVECAPALTQINSIFVMLASEKDINDKINNKVYIFWVLLIISLFIIIITTKNIADDIINPVKALIIGIKEVNRENFSFRINSDRTDELGALCLSFDKMIKGLDEKRMMSRMISNTARMVTLDEGTVTFGKTDAVLLYIGIPDFSKVMDSLGEFEVFDLLKKHTAVMAGIIMKEGGEVDKIIGEKMLAVFRVNNNPSEIALAAYRVATRMLELERTNQLSFSIAIGLNYGNVINGFLGVGNKRDFTVIGDPVNVSARIESLAECLENNRCVISETFYKLVNNSVNATVYGEVELKGKSQPMKVYQLS